MELIFSSIIGLMCCCVYFLCKIKHTGDKNYIKPKNEPRGYVDTNKCNNCGVIGLKSQLKINQPCVRCGWFICENEPSKWVVIEGKGKWVSMYSSEEGSNMDEKIGRFVSDYTKLLKKFRLDVHTPDVSENRLKYTFPPEHPIFKDKENEWLHKISDKSYNDLIKRVSIVIGHSEPYHLLFENIIYNISKEYKK